MPINRRTDSSITKTTQEQEQTTGICKTNKQTNKQTQKQDAQQKKYIQKSMLPGVLEGLH